MIQSLKRRLNVVELHHQVMAKQKRKQHTTMRETIIKYGEVFHEAEHPGEPYTDECRKEDLWLADISDAEPPHTLEDTQGMWQGLN